MDVNRDNFYRVLPEILQDITDADYVAIDGEFTGILSFDKMNYFDTPAERHQRHYECDRHYLLIQVGLTMIRCKNPTDNRYSLKAYNFYLFSDNEMNGFDFRSKSSSLQFLAANRFDFAQLFLKGIPFVCKTPYLEKLRNQQQLASRRINHQTPNGNCNDKSSEGNTNNITTNSSKQSESTNLSDAELLSKSINGFSEVIWKLQESGKPIIGHNLQIDVLHIINQFFTPIPPSYEEYKSIVKSLFPKLIDTKIIASTSIFQSIIPNTALNAVYKTVQEQNFPKCCFETPDNFRYSSGEYEHTAGYDATCTAVCMTKMMAYIAEKTNFKENPIEHPLINSFTGKLFYMRSFDLRYTDILHDDDLPDRSGVFYVTHPLSWSTSNIREYLQRWNYLSCERFDLTRHIVGMSLKSETMETILTKMRTTNSNLIITPYAEFKHLDVSKIKIKERNHLFDIDPTQRNPYKRAHVDTQEMIPISPMEIETPILLTVKPLITTINCNSASRTAQKNVSLTTDQREKAKGVKKRKTFESDHE